MKKRIWELAKSLLIVLLLCSLLFLTAFSIPVETIRRTPWLSALVQPFAPILGLPEAELVYMEELPPVLDAAKPRVISVNSPAGRQTIRWDFDALDQAGESLGGILAEALDTASEPQPVSQAALQTALCRPGVLFDYGFPLPLSLLGAWLSAAVPETDAQAGSYLLSASGDTVQLYLYSPQGPVLRADTQVSGLVLTGMLGQYHPDGSRFAFEEDSPLAPLTLLPREAPAVRLAKAVSPCTGRFQEQLSVALGFNPYDDTSYTDPAGICYYSESNRSLEIAPGGQILLLNNAPDRFLAPSDTRDALVEMARSLVELAMRDALGEARLYLSGLSDGAEGETVCTFDYLLRGVPVDCAGQPAATVTFRGRQLTELRLLAVTMTTAGEAPALLPPRQAAAILRPGSTLILQYHLSPDGGLSAGWRQS